MDIRGFFSAILQGYGKALQEQLGQPQTPLDLIQARQESDGGTGLHVAVHTCNLEVARVLIDAGIDLDARNAGGRTALHDAIEHGCSALEELLLESGAHVDVCAAAILGRKERLCELLDEDAELANERSTGLSPLGWAAFGNRVDTAAELLARGARMDDGELLCAASVGHVEVGRLLIRHGADPNATWSDAAGTALHAACSMKYTDDSRAFVEMLLECGADPEARTADGETVLELAERKAGEVEEGTVRRKVYDEILDALRRGSG